MSPWWLVLALNLLGAWQLGVLSPAVSAAEAEQATRQVFHLSEED